jgi:predicted Zn-dependent protease
MKRFYLGILFIVMGTVLVMGGTYQHKDGGISIWFPDNWKVTTNEGMLEVTSPDEEVYIHMLVLQDAESLDAAIDAYLDQLDQVVSDFVPSSEEGKEVEINGLNVFLIDGEGKVDGVPLDVAVALVGSETAVTMMVTCNSKNAAKKYGQEFEKIVRSLKAL